MAARLPGLVLSLLVGLSVVAYPFLIYWGLSRFSIPALALVLVGLYLLRFLWVGRRDPGAARRFLPMLAAVLVVCGLALWHRDEGFFLYYPVLVNVILLMVFGTTLNKPPSMIERFARLREPNLPPEGVVYCRKVTKIWCIFFIANGTISLITILSGSMQWWTLYNGLVSYLLMGLLFGLELVVRIRFKKRLKAREREGV